MIEAALFDSLPNGEVLCKLCSHYCRIKPNKLGICRVRKNIDGKLYSLNSDKLISMSSDPIEKKPLYHFLPSSISYSIATMGCNFSCEFCQNHSISIVKETNEIYGKNIHAKEIVENALKVGAKSIAYTYTEPTIYYELVKDVMKEARKNNIKNIMVSNGFMSSEAIDTLFKDIDGINIDIKAFSDGFYKKYCKGVLSPVLETVKRFKKFNIHTELTTLLIDKENDSEDEIKRLIDFIIGIDPEIPWHISRFYPTYKFFDRNPTSIETIYRVIETAKKMGLKYVYGGNIPDDNYSDTLCPDCNAKLIGRTGYNTEIVNLKINDVNEARCGICGKKITGVWQ